MSGIRDYFEEEESDDYEALWRDRPCYAMRRPADFLPLFGDLEPLRPPGVRLQYSNAGYVVLGLLIEELSARPYSEAVQAAVFAPAGMDRSGFFALDEVNEDVATGYQAPVDDGPWRSNIYGLPVVGGADGGAFSCARDIDRFLRAYADGVLVDPGPMLTPRAPLADGIDMGYGVYLYRDGRFGHGGGDPGVSVLAAHHRGTGVSSIVLSNVPGTTVAVRDLLLEAAVLAR
jgi:CubicO group peptidase (beta-lactamase class C family)